MQRPGDRGHSKSSHPSAGRSSGPRVPGSTQSLVVLLPLQGASPAGGCLIALTCDYRVMADNPKYCIGLNETLLGIVAPFW